MSSIQKLAMYVVVLLLLTVAASLPSMSQTKPVLGTPVPIAKLPKEKPAEFELNSAIYKDSAHWCVTADRTLRCALATEEQEGIGESCGCYRPGSKKIELGHTTK